MKALSITLLLWAGSLVRRRQPRRGGQTPRRDESRNCEPLQTARHRFASNRPSVYVCRRAVTCVGNNSNGPSAR